MQAFKAYFRILKKQLPAILIYCALFVGITAISASNQKGNGSVQFNLTKVPIAIDNNDTENEFIEGFLQYVEKYADFVELKDSDEARSDALFFREVEYIITIPEGFTEEFLAGGEVSLMKQSIPDSTVAISVDRAVNNYLNTAQTYLKYMPEISEKELNKFVLQNLSNETKVSIDRYQKEEKENTNSYYQFFFNTLAYVIVCCFIIGVSTVMLSFSNIDIRRRNLVTPISNRKINLQLILANFIFVMGFLLLFLFAGYLSNPDKGINTNTILFWVNIFTFALTVLSLSYLIGITVKSKKAISALSTSVSLGLAFISGAFVPQEFLGESVLKVASFTPTYWYVRANDAIAALTSFRWDDIYEILGFMAIQIGFAAAIISIALVVSKRKSQQAY